MKAVDSELRQDQLRVESKDTSQNGVIKPAIEGGREDAGGVFATFCGGGAKDDRP